MALVCLALEGWQAEFTGYSPADSHKSQYYLDLHWATWQHIITKPSRCHINNMAKTERNQLQSVTLEVKERRQIVVINSAPWRGQSWVPASQHLTNTHQVLYHDGSNKHNPHASVIIHRQNYVHNLYRKAGKSSKNWNNTICRHLKATGMTWKEV